MLQKAGFIEFSRFNFEIAQSYFSDGSVDPRELISLFPGLLSTETDFRRSRPPLHGFADINQITRGDLQKMEDCKSALIRYLESNYPKQDQKKVILWSLEGRLLEFLWRTSFRLIKRGEQCKIPILRLFRWKFDSNTESEILTWSPNNHKRIITGFAHPVSALWSIHNFVITGLAFPVRIFCNRKNRDAGNWTTMVPR